MNRVITHNVLLAAALMFLTGCRALQPVVWQYNAPMDARRAGVVNVSAKCEVSADNIELLREAVQSEVDKVLADNGSQRNAYEVDVVITKYDRGTTPLRMLTLGFGGRIYLYGEVTVRERGSPDAIAFGRFEKWYGPILPLASMFASMEWTVIPKTGKAVARAIRKSTEKE
jgi:hypothetical protein